MVNNFHINLDSIKIDLSLLEKLRKKLNMEGKKVIFLDQFRNETNKTNKF